MATGHIRNGNRDSPPKLGVGVVKVVVVGEPSVGKTSLITAYYKDHEPGARYSYNGVRAYPCEFVIDGTHKRAEIFEIPGVPEFYKDLRTPHYTDAKVIVMMYSIDRPLSLELLTDKWLPEAEGPIAARGIPVVLVGNKKDLRENPQVIAALALNEEQPVTYEQGADLFVYEEIRGFCEISTLNIEEVNEVFDMVFNLADY